VLKSENRGQQGIYTLVSGLQAGKGENVFFEFLILWHCKRHYFPNLYLQLNKGMVL